MKKNYVFQNSFHIKKLDLDFYQFVDVQHYISKRGKRGKFNESYF